MSLHDWNHFLRPNVWAFGIAVFLIGLLSSGLYSLPSYAAGLAVVVMLMTSSITANHYFDYESDRKSSQLHRFPVAAGRISLRLAGLFSLAAIALSILLAYLFLLTNAFYLTLFANFMVVSYSVPRLRIKERPFFETFWNGLGYGSVPFYLALITSGQAITLQHHMLGLVTFLIAASGHILLQVRDIRDDRMARVKTTSTMLGLERMKRVSQAMVFAAGLVIIYLALTRFLNPMAWLSILAGALVIVEHRRMGHDVTKSYRRLQIIYIAGGLFFIISVARF